MRIKQYAYQYKNISIHYESYGRIGSQDNYNDLVIALKKIGIKNQFSSFDEYKRVSQEQNSEHVFKREIG